MGAVGAVGESWELVELADQVTMFPSPALLLPYVVVSTGVQWNVLQCGEAPVLPCFRLSIR